MTALVATRVFPDVAPQDADLPLLVVTVIDDVPASTLNGHVGATLSNARVQVDAYAKTRAEAAAVAAATAASASARACSWLSAQASALAGLAK